MVSMRAGSLRPRRSRKYGRSRIGRRMEWGEATRRAVEAHSRLRAHLAGAASHLIRAKQSVGSRPAREIGRPQVARNLRARASAGKGVRLSKPKDYVRGPTAAVMSIQSPMAFKITRFGRRPSHSP